MLPIVGGLAFSLQEQRARTAKRNHARRRFEQRNARLQREEQQKIAERQARAQRAVQPSEVPLDPVQAALERVRAQKAANADAALEKAKIDLAMSRAQLNKSLKAFGHPPTFEQQSQLIVLQQQFEAAEQALAQLERSAARLAPRRRCGEGRRPETRENPAGHASCRTEESPSERCSRRADRSPGARARAKPNARWMHMPPLESVDERLQQAMKLVLLATAARNAGACSGSIGWGVLINLMLAGRQCAWPLKRRLLRCAQASAQADLE